MNKRNILLIIVFMLILSGCKTKIQQENSSTNTEELKQEEVIEQEEIEDKEISITLSFIGDVTLGNYAGQSMAGSFDQEYINQKKNSSYFFNKVNSYFKEDDLTIANLEGPLTTADAHPQKTFAFKGKKEYVNILNDANIDVVTLANNHSHDRYDQGMKDTKNVLDKNDVGHFGYEEKYITEVKGIKIGFLGYAFPYSVSSQMKKAIKALKKEVDIVVIYFHWGIERSYTPNGGQKTIARKCVDLGADLVIGSHPHVLQGYETYNGKNIVYSLGNFCFGGNKNPSDKDTAIYQHTFNFKNNELVNQSSKIIPCRVSSTKSRNNYQPVEVTGDDAKRVLKKIKKI